ncbi:SdhA [Fluoribacter gormanii]|uniref:SdhA n=1 Tax=Fluoribacter gormanii TaxID=464 RepID=UPI0010411560|nr:SdhA [Fluoribacter gormanii]
MIFEEYVKLLESFKQNQISKILEQIDTKIFEILYSKHVSPRIVPYFPRYELCFMSDETKLEAGKLYIREQNGKIAYSVITPDNQTIQDAVLDELDAPSPFKYTIAPRTNLVKPEAGFFYARMLATGLEYTVIDPTGKLVVALIKKEELKINLGSNFTPRDLEPFMPEILNITSKRNHTLPFTLDAFRAQVLSATSRKGHTKWAPFTNYSLDPDNISQIKKLINALYYARLTFLDLENIDVRNKNRSYSDLNLLYSKTIDLAYEASYLLTHLDVDLREMFQEELSLILPFLSQVQTFFEKFMGENHATIKALDPLPLAYKAGTVAGIAVDQMRPISSDVDYNFLAQFSAVLPSYIDRLTNYIKQFSSEIKESEEKLNKQKLDELQNAALNLLNEIENLKGNSVFVSLKFLNYIHIIRNVITLSMSSLEQMGELSESSQDVLRDKLAQLKYNVLPGLFSLVDKIEDNAMLKPGTLSIPLMEKVKVLYDQLLYLPKKAIDFKAKGEELLEIEDHRFIELRLEMVYKRIDKANKALYRIQKAQTASEAFFQILKNYKTFRLSQLPSEVKQELINHYKLLKPYMIQLDIDLNQIIISNLVKPEKEEKKKEDWYTFIGRSLQHFKREPTIDLLLNKDKMKMLTDLITKDENSQLFHINLNKDLIDSVHKKANLALFPYSEKTNVYTLDETIPLQVEQEKDKKSRLTKEEFRRIQNAYLRFAQIIKNQIKANPEHYEKNLDLSLLDDKVKEECLKLFNIFQPYLTSIILPEFDEAGKKKVLQPYLSSIITSEVKKSAKNFECYLSALFAKKAVSDIPSTELFLGLDQNIQTFFDHINFEWCNKNKFKKILMAYTRFAQIIKKQIEEKPQLYGNNLLLTSLDEQAKEECRELYPIFQPFFKFAIPPKLRNSAQNFEQYLAALLANKPVEILEAPPSSLFLQLDVHVQDFLAKWQDKSQMYYDFTKVRFLDENESMTLRSKRAKEKKLHFKSVNGDNLLQNREQLSADQALEVYQWYRNKHTKFLVVQNAYIQFITLLRKEIRTKPQIKGNMLLLNRIVPKVKDQCRNLYSIFQPFFICAVPPEMKKEALKLDKYLVAILSNNKISIKNAPSVRMFLDLDMHFQEFFADITKEWNRRRERFYNLAQKKFILENKLTKLKAEPKTGREHYVIQHTNYSKCIHEFRQSLFGVTQLLNNTMQIALTPQDSEQSLPRVIDMSPEGLLSQAMRTVFPPSSLPFPEMEDNNKRLAQSRQVCALKDIFNSLFHLEGIALELENLNNKSAKSRYVYYLLKAYGHLNEIVKSSKRLAADPHLGLIARDLLDKAQELYATFQEHSDAYQVSPEQVPYGETKVQYNTLWYVLNAFYISPKHIRALKNTNFLTTEELNQLHLRARKATSFIEDLINNSNSYFKLFLQTPRMIYLYQELTTKLNEFTTTSHDGIIDNLEKMRSTVFTPMLLEADLWENKLGLAPGALSGPLRQITDEFFKGLLHPLDLKSKKYIRLVCDEEPLKQRTDITKKRIRNVEKFIKKIEKEYQDIENLYHWYRIVTTPIEAFDLTAPNLTKEELDKAKFQLNAAYKKALPKLAKLKRDKKVEIPPSQYPEDHQLDELCNFGLKAYDPHFTEIEALITASHHYYLGLKATHQMKLDTLKEKLDYLQDLVPTQRKEKLTFIKQFTIESFDKHLEKMCNDQVGLQYTDIEYRTQLKAYLLKLKTEIVAKSEPAKDIDRSINKLLQIEISKFEKKYYVDYYHLDEVLVALAQFKIYFKNSRIAINKGEALFESKETLNEKSRCITTLNTIATDTTLEVQERLRQIRTHVVKDPNFTRIILEPKKVNSFSFTYLKMCFISLLEALNLYTPTRKKLLDQLNDAVKKPPEIGELTKRFGLFATTQAQKKVEAKRYAAPAMPIP